MSDPVWHRQQRGKIEWLAVTTLAAGVTAVAALATAVAVFWYVRQDTQRVLLNTTLDSLWHLDAQWNSDGMLDARSAAAAALLDGRPTEDVDVVLDFLDETARLLQRGGLDEEMVWYQFYWPMMNYWAASQERVREVRQSDATAWEALDKMLPRLTTREARRKRRSAEAARPTDAQTHDFLTAESGADECVDDDAVRKTPL